MKLGKKDTSPSIKNKTSVNKCSTKKNLFTCKGQGHPMIKFKICVKTEVFACFETIFKLVNERTQESN